MKANYNESSKKTVFTIKEAVNTMLARMPKQFRADYEPILNMSLTRLSINGVYADQLFTWKKIDSEHVALV